LRLFQWERKGFYSLFAAALIVTTGITLGSCATVGLSISLPQGDPSQIPATEELVRSLAKRVDQVRSLRSLSFINYQNNDERGGFRVALLVDRPDRLRLETLSPLGAILVLTANGDEVVGFLPRKRILYRGVSSKQNLYRFTQIPLELTELTSLLLGLPPVKAEGPWKGEDHAIHRSLPSGGSEWVVFDPALGVPIRWDRLDSHGDTELSAVFSDFVSTTAGSFPLRIFLESGTEEKTWEIRYREPEVNVQIPVPLFVQQRPSHVREISLESIGG